MRKVAAFVVIVVASVLVSARSAEAQGGIMEWLERLSGPGPFEGPAIQVTFGCYGSQKGRATDGDPVFGSEDHRTRAGSLDWFADFGCGKAVRNLPRVSVGAHVARLTGKNNLSYAASVPLDQTTDVEAFILQGFVDFGLHRSLEVGFGAGFVRFDGLPVDLTRAALQPIRVTLKPVTFGGTKKLYAREFLTLQFIGSWFPGGFTAEDFGAIPGTFDSGNEIQASVSIGFDVLAFSAFFRN